MRTKFIGMAAVMGMAVLILTLAGGCAQTATSSGGVERMAPPPPPGDDAEIMPPPPPDGGEEMMPPPPPPPGFEGGKRHGKGFKRMAEELNLTPEQREKFKALRKDQGAAMKKLRESIRAKREELRVEMDNEKTDKAKIDGITADLKKLEGERVDQEVKGILQMKETLTPEQFKKLGAMHEEMRERRPGKGHKRGHGGGEEKDAPPHAAPRTRSVPAGASTAPGTK